ncbi:MAG: hypothetical protein HRU70_05635 [Phycisphaeraceae bacterium]|nr:MAG: hypothetical protein HRU70_05635 [Phycisphaeraceae bacterium]
MSDDPGHGLRGGGVRSLGRALLAAGVVMLSLGAGVSRGDDLGYIRLFEQDYRLHRFDYASMVRYPDAKTPGGTVALTSVTGAHSLGDGRYLVSTNTGNFLPAGSFKNYVLEVRLTLDEGGLPSGVTYVRTVLHNDPARDGYDLDPRGVTVNTSAWGLGAGGNLVVASAGNMLRQFDLATGESMDWGPGINGFPTTSPNTSTEDAVYVPSRAMFFTSWRFPASAVTMFSRAGRTGPAFYCGRSRYAGSAGMPVGMAYLNGGSNYPRLFDYRDGVLVATDNNEPSLEYYEVDSRAVRRERLSSTLQPGATTLPLRSPETQLWLSGIAAEHSSGRLLLFNRGVTMGAMDVFVLTPVPVPCLADFNLDGFVDFFDFDDYMTAFEQGDPRADYDHDGFIDFFDLDLFTEGFDVGC